MSTTVENWWESFLSLWRALLLGAKIKDPQALTQLLLFLPPVEYLTTKQVAVLLADTKPCHEELEEELPKGWTLGPATTDFQSGGEYDVTAQIYGETLSNLLRSEHPEWSKDWRWSFDWNGDRYLSYRVRDKKRKVHPIACWMEGKLQLLHDKKEFDPEAQRTVVEEFLEREVEYLLSDDLDGTEAAESPLGKAIAAIKQLPSWEEACEEIAHVVYDQGDWSVGNFDQCEENCGQAIIDYAAGLKRTKARRKKKPAAATIENLAA